MASNTLEWVIKLQDQASAISKKVIGSVTRIENSVSKVNAKLQDLNPISTKALGKLYNSSKNAIVGSKNLTSSISNLEAKITTLNDARAATTVVSDFRKLSQEIEKAEQQLARLKNGISDSGWSSKMQGWRKDFAESLPGANLIKNPLTLAGSALGGFWGATQKAMDAGKEKIKLQTITGSKEIGESLYKGLTDFATDTVFGSEVYDMGVQMLANGIKDTDVMPLMNQLGDISMGDSQKLGQLSLAFAQINGKGKLAGQELLQLINAGFNPLQVISDKTGESMGSLQDKMSKGAISVEHVRWAMEQATGPGGNFHNMLEDVANTPYGQLEGLRGQIEQLVITLGETFIPIASKIMAFFSWLGEKLGPLLQPVSIGIASLSVAILAMAAAQWVLNLAVWSFPGTWIVLKIMVIVAAVAFVIKHFDSWGATLLWLLGPIGRIIAILVELYRHWEDIKNAFKVGGIVEGLRVLGNTLIRAVLDPIKQILGVIAKIPGPIGRTAQSAIEGIEGIESKMDKRDQHNKYLAALEETKQKIATEQHNKYLDGLAKATGGKLGKFISEPTLPGTNIPEFASDGKKEKDDTGSKTNEAIATGGTRNTTVNITIGNLVKDFNLTASNLKESKDEILDAVTDALTRAVSVGAALGS